MVAISRRSDRPQRPGRALSLAMLAALALVLQTTAVASACRSGPGESAAAAPSTSSAVRAGSVTEEARTTATSIHFPTARSTGVPVHWQPRRTVHGNYSINRAGAVVEDLRVVNGSILVNAPNVTLRRVEVLGGTIGNFEGGTCNGGLVIRRTTVAKARGQVTDGSETAISTGSYKAVRTEINGLPEGFRVGGKPEGCGRVVIKDSYARIVYPDQCGDWHGDALQGWQGPALKLRHTRLILKERDGCGGTAPFFYPGDQGNTSVNIDGLLVQGGGYSFRLGTPGSVRNLNIVRGFYYGPILVNCSLLSAWQAHIVKLNAQNQPVTLRRQRCNT